jgi:hypothetical protein
MPLPPVKLPSSGPEFTEQLERLLQDVRSPRLFARLLFSLKNEGWAPKPEQRYEQVREAIVRTQLAGLLPGERFGFCVSLAMSLGESFRTGHLKSDPVQKWLTNFWDILCPLCPASLSLEDVSSLNFQPPDRTPYWAGPPSNDGGWDWIKDPNLASTDNPSFARSLYFCIAGGLHQPAFAAQSPLALAAQLKSIAELAQLEAFVSGHPSQQPAPRRRL